MISNRKAVKHSRRDEQQWADNKVNATISTVFVCGLPLEIVEKHLINHFGKYGSVESCKIVMTHERSHSKRFAIVEYKYPISISILSVHHLLLGHSLEIREFMPPEKARAKLDSEKSRKIFIGGLPPLVTEEEIVEYFGKYGRIEHCNIVYNHLTKVSRGFGFVTFDKEKRVQDVLNNYKEHYIQGKWIECKPAVLKEEIVGPRANQAQKKDEDSRYGESSGHFDELDSKNASDHESNEKEEHATHIGDIAKYYSGFESSSQTRYKEEEQLYTRYLPPNYKDSEGYPKNDSSSYNRYKQSLPYNDGYNYDYNQSLENHNKEYFETKDRKQKSIQQPERNNTNTRDRNFMNAGQVNYYDTTQNQRGKVKHELEEDDDYDNDNSLKDQIERPPRRNRKRHRNRKEKEEVEDDDEEEGGNTAPPRYNNKEENYGYDNEDENYQHDQRNNYEFDAARDNYEPGHNRESHQQTNPRMQQPYQNRPVITSVPTMAKGKVIEQQKASQPLDNSEMGYYNYHNGSYSKASESQPRYIDQPYNYSSNQGFEDPSPPYNHHYQGQTRQEQELLEQLNYIPPPQRQPINREREKTVKENENHQAVRDQRGMRDHDRPPYSQNYPQASQHQGPRPIGNYSGHQHSEGMPSKGQMLRSQPQGQPMMQHASGAEKKGSHMLHRYYNEGENSKPLSNIRR